MPLKHIKYGCSYKCGRKHNSNKSIIMEHEKTCWLNPSLRACNTCKQNKLVANIADQERYWDCKIVDGMNLQEAIYNCIYKNRDQENEYYPIIRCPYWEREGD